MRNQDQIAPVALLEGGPCRIIGVMADREEGKLPVRATDRDGRALTADAGIEGLVEELALRLPCPVKLLPFHRVEPLKAAADHGIDPDIVLLDIVTRPLGRVGACPELLALLVGPVIDDMRDSQGITQRRCLSLQLGEGCRSLQPVERSF